MALPGFDRRQPKRDVPAPTRPAGRAGPRVERLAWLGLKVADVMAEALFLEETLGLRHLDEGNSPAGHHLRYDGGTLQLELVSGGATWAGRPKPRRGQPDLPLIPSFQVGDIGDLANRLRDRQTLLTQVYEQGWSASFLFFDPERNLWQANETRTEPGPGPGQPPLVGALWLAVEDFSGQLAFYRDVLGLPLVEEVTRIAPITLEAEQFQRDQPPAGPQTGGPAYEDWGEQPARRFKSGVDNESLGAIFFNTGARLALSPGGTRLEGGAARVWGRDTAFLPGLQTNDLAALQERLRAAGIETGQPFPFTSPSRDDFPHRRSRAYPDQIERRTGRAFRFVDPEGHGWQVFE